MKKLFLILFALTCLFLSTSAAAKEITFQGVFTVPDTATEIDLGKVQVQSMDRFIEFLDQLPNLKKVNMFSSPIGRKKIKRLVERYPEIEFGWTMRFYHHTIRTDATAFSTLNGSDSIWLQNEDVSILKYCKDLLALDLGHNDITDLSFLYSMPKLKVLILACNIHLKDITPIGSLKDLEYLELFKNDVNDISPLTQCKKLIDLNITISRIRDWTPLHEMKTLERLWMYNSNNWSDQSPVDPKVVSAVREALPDCHVDSVSDSTAGGWRKHPRYYVIYEIFHTDQYIPFSQAEEIAKKYRNNQPVLMVKPKH